MHAEAKTESFQPPLRDVIPLTVYEDADDVIASMVEIGDALEGADLGHLKAFNDVYLRLTRTVVYRARHPDEFPPDERFDQPETVMRTVGIFADYWFKQLRAHTGLIDEDVDPAWQILFYDENARKAQPGVQFLLGMNAHINYDLPQALRDSGVDQAYYDDYKRVVGMLIELTAEELAPDYIPGPSIPRNWLKERVVTLIANWREQAWDNGMALLVAKNHRLAELAEGLVADARFTVGEVATNAILRYMNQEAIETGEFILTPGNLALSGLSRVATVGRWLF